MAGQADQAYRKAIQQSYCRNRKLYRTEAEKQVATAQNNRLVDYKEYRRYMDENERLRQNIQEIAGEKDNSVKHCMVCLIFSLLPIIGNEYSLLLMH